MSEHTAEKPYICGRCRDGEHWRCAEPGTCACTEPVDDGPDCAQTGHRYPAFGSPPGEVDDYCMDCGRRRSVTNQPTEKRQTFVMPEVRTVGLANSPNGESA